MYLCDNHIFYLTSEHARNTTFIMFSLSDLGGTKRYVAPLPGFWGGHGRLGPLVSANQSMLGIYE